MKTKLFISKNREELHYLPEFCWRHGIQLTAQSQISFRSIPHSSNAVSADVIFFSSPRSVAHCGLSLEELKRNSLAVIGSGTADALQKLGLTCDFIGTQSGKPAAVAQEFITWLGDRKVLFPVSSISNESISSCIPHEQKEVVVVYETICAPSDIAPQDLYVFTSPSNLNCFLKTNVIAADSKVIAWGTSSALSAELNGLPVAVTMKTSNELALMTHLRELLKLI